ncbi:hypothetical protein V493_08634 [Pseudogymnoascus sp. VKM F-4281 (FW-2241)]|nr:hypothetical protein V493_08634 [Pseudogymnoascus sp. VKM F-4281 (FW-2241)]
MAPSEREWKMMIIVSALVGLATIAAILRLYARFKLHVRIEADDYLCFTALFLLYGMLIQSLSPTNSPTLLSSRSLRYPSSASTAASSLLLTDSTSYPAPLSGLLCRPLRGYWDKTMQATCIDGNVFFIVNQGFNVVMDFVILALPLPIIFNLKRAWQDKVALSAIFALGGFVCFASIYRIVVLFYIDPNDATHTVYQATLWTHIEPSVGLICSCLPTIRGLFPAYHWHSQSSPYPPDHHYIDSSSNRGAEHLVPSDLSKNSVYIMMEDGVVKPEQERWAEERHDIEENRGRREGGTVARTSIGDV